MQLASPRSPHSLGHDRDPKRRTRKPVSCEPCRHSKLKCDRQLPCATCLRRGWQESCSYDATPKATRRFPPRKKTQPRHSRSEPESEIPVASSPEPASPQNLATLPLTTGWDAILCRPPVVTAPAPTDAPVTLPFGPSIPKTELLGMLPPSSICDYLISLYFIQLSPLFHVLHGPTFQGQYSAFLRDPQQVDLAWLALVFAICSLTVRTVDPVDPALEEIWESASSPRDLPFLSQQYRNAAMMCLSQDQFLVRHNLSTLEALLVLIHTISHGDGAEHGWALLGSALNIGIALRCYVDPGRTNLIERERRRRCWAGILILHTVQALVFRDIDLSFLNNIKAQMPAEVNDEDIQEDAIIMPQNRLPSAQLTQTSLLNFQIRLFQLATRVCSHISGPDRLSEKLLSDLDSAVSEESQQWDSVYLVNGSPSILDTARYAHWSVLQTWAHQLYLLLHRPFHHSRTTQFVPTSRDRCIKSSVALLDIHRQFYELPRLKPYRWLVNGTMTCNALHGAVALTSCLLDMPNDSDFSKYLCVIDAAVRRLEALQEKSPACSNVYPLMRHLQSRLCRQPQTPSLTKDIDETRFQDWVSNIDWFRPDEIDWDFWDGDFTTPHTDDHETTTIYNS
ncbi:hypothetical protein BGZ61DRAFT_364461 [Ilyonectria robusta]|uniref:uncharacterized protein n=1 Tax=Ilyonectria robusta TaxID=1079257 RepID=UPI001E8D1D30|nr:uncharacterized protein BGZ61DRAFT_364461 [Ilyonectria robusta]KAH8669406.1 hypothetical protein BGZ61DRAFT_364461 [Ilyonectria robusta]